MKMISELLTRYDSGTLTRRELITALTMLAVTGRTASAAGRCMLALAKNCVLRIDSLAL